MFNKSLARYINGQYEKCPTTDKLHVQFYMNFEEPKRFSALKKLCKRTSFHKVGIDNA